MGIHQWAILTAAATFGLIFVGGLVTSTGSGLAVPDWPLSFGQVFPPLVGGVLYEHGHRMVAASVGLLMMVLAIWIWFKEPRAWVRRLGVAALLTILLQGLLGGITVLYHLPTPVSVAHALLAQAFFCLTVALAVVTSPRWEALAGRSVRKGRLSLLGGCVITTAVVYGQILLGAVMRHTGAGLAIPDFPLAFGRLLPPIPTQAVLIHFLHRVGALVVTVCVVGTVALVIGRYRGESWLLHPALAMLILLIVQIALGAFTIWTGMAVLPTTAHVAGGAALLATSLILTLRSYRLLTPTRSLLLQGGGRGWRGGDFLALTKPRVVLMVLVTTLVGFYLGSPGPLDIPLLLKTLFGTTLAAGGTIALNQYLEREVDARMDRTRLRPLPDGRLRPAEALAFGVSITAAGLLSLTLTVNALAGLITAVIVGSYVFVYTPLKRKTPLCSVVGAIPGALPPVTGWAAARGELGLGAWVLFAILFLWQLPHSLAIATLYRDDYARGGIRVLPVVDSEGGRTRRQIVSNCLALLAVGFLPSLIGLAGSIYFFTALLLGVGFLGCGILLALFPSTTAARRLLLASLVYLPVLLLVMALDKIPF